MEENEIRTEEFNENEETEVYVEPETSGKGTFGKIAIGASILGGLGAIAAFIYKKNRKSIEERRIRKLERKGYIIQRPIDVDSNENVFDAEVEDTNE